MFEEKLGAPLYELSHKYVETPDPDSYSRHTHNYCELLLFIRGEANYNIEGILYQPKPYDLLIIPRAAYHYCIPTSSMPYENYVLDFDGSLLTERHRQKVFAEPTILNIKEDKDFCRFFKTLDLYHETYRREDFFLCTKSLLRELVVFCSYRMDQLTRVEPGRPALIHTILQLIEENLERPLDAEQLAQELQFSKSYLQNAFSASMHIGLKQYIMQKKIFAAHNDMVRGMSASAACAKYAFSDYTVFFRLYKRLLGYSPRQTKEL